MEKTKLWVNCVLLVFFIRWFRFLMSCLALPSDLLLQIHSGIDQHVWHDQVEVGNEAYKIVFFCGFIPWYVECQLNELLQQNLQMLKILD